MSSHSFTRTLKDETGYGAGGRWRGVFQERLARRLALAVTALGLMAGAAGAQEVPAKGIFDGHGVVKAVAPGTGWLTIAHGDIKGFMPAMEMIYKVRSPDLSKDLHPGDVVDFKIDAANYVIVEVKLTAHAK